MLLRSVRLVRAILTYAFLLRVLSASARACDGELYSRGDIRYDAATHLWRTFIIMSATSNNFPEATEYAPYYGRYVSLVPAGDILTVLSEQLDSTQRLLRGIDEEKAAHRYAPDKWSIKELVGHIIDTERIFAYRALRFARNDLTGLPGFEQDDYIRHADFDACPLGELVREFEFVRGANLLMFKHLSDEAWQRRGIASGGEVSVRALAFIMAGHERHHMEILRTRYL